MRPAPRVRFGLTMAAIAASATLLLTSCSAGAGGGDGGGSSAAPTAEDLASVKIDLTSPIYSLDPTNNPYQENSQIVALTSAALFQFTRDSATETEPVLAESIAASDDGLTHTVTLQEGLTFSDGSPLTATTVANSLTRLRDTEAPNAIDVANFADIRAVDDLTVEITLTQPVADLTQTLALPSTGIVAADVADAEYFEGDPVFSGAYVPEGDILSNSYALVRNEAFGGATPAIEKLEFTVIDDPVTTATRLQGGEIDFAPELPEEIVPQISGDLTATSVERVASLFLIPNNRDGEVFADVKLRQALAWAVDREALAAVVFGENVAVQSGPYPVPADYPEPVDVYPGQDLDRAKELLAGTACASGCQITVNYFATDDAIGRAALVLQQQLEPLGIEIVAEPVESQQFIQNSLDGAFDMNFVESGGFNVPNSFTGAFDQTSACIYAGCVKPEFQSKAEALFGAADDAAADAASTAVLEAFEAWTPIVPLAGSTSTYGVKSSLADTIVLQPNVQFWIAAE